MRPSRRLEVLRVVVEKRLERLRMVVLGAQPKPIRRWEGDVCYVTLDLLNTWGNFARVFYLGCVFGAKTAGGVVIQSAQAFPSPNDAIGYVIGKWNQRATPLASGVWRRRDEPAWHVKNRLLDLAISLGFSNQATVAAALSLPSQSLDHLPTFRNFFAHRNDSTFKLAMTLSPGYGIYGVRKPSEVLMARGPRRPQPLIMDWIDEVSSVVEQLCL